MPFSSVEKKGVTKSFEDVLQGLRAYLTAPDFILRHLPPRDGWRWEDYVAALDQMVADSSDELWTKVFKDHEGRLKMLEEPAKDTGESKVNRATAALLKRVDALEAAVNDPAAGLAFLALVVSRLDEVVTSMSAGDGKATKK